MNRVWVRLGQLAESMAARPLAVRAYASALQQDPLQMDVLLLVATLCRSLEEYQQATVYYKRILAINESDGEVWAALGHSFLMLDQLQNAYHAYQQALFHLPNPKEPKLWYGIGILYDRFGSLEHAQEAFMAVIRMDGAFEKAPEVYFRLGIIYKQQRLFADALLCFEHIQQAPPAPLKPHDITFQIGHIHEQQHSYMLAKVAYEAVLGTCPAHAKVLQQLGWLYHNPATPFQSHALALSTLQKSLDSDDQDPQTWYLLGRVHMSKAAYTLAYESYQQAVYRDGRNPTFWCSIGVLYYQISQYSDALDAYTRAIKLDPAIPEVWYDLGCLYETCNNQREDALDAYRRALELDPRNEMILARVESLVGGGGGGGEPVPREIEVEFGVGAQRFDAGISPTVSTLKVAGLSGVAKPGNVKSRPQSAPTSANAHAVKWIQDGPLSQAAPQAAQSASLGPPGFQVQGVKWVQDGPHPVPGGPQGAPAQAPVQAQRPSQPGIPRQSSLPTEKAIERNIDQHISDPLNTLAHVSHSLQQPMLQAPHQPSPPLPPQTFFQKQQHAPLPADDTKRRIEDSQDLAEKRMKLEEVKTEDFEDDDEGDEIEGEDDDDAFDAEKEMSLDEN